MGPEGEKLYPLHRKNLSYNGGHFLQFPVSCQIVITYNIVQGLTFREKMILALDKDRRKNNHICKHGVFYVTVTRPTRPDLLHFSTSDFTEEFFDNMVKKNAQKEYQDFCKTCDE